MRHHFSYITYIHCLLKITIGRCQDDARGRCTRAIRLLYSLVKIVGAGRLLYIVMYNRYCRQFSPVHRFQSAAMTTSIRFLLLSFFGGANPLTSTTATCKANHDEAEKGKFRRRRRRRRSRHCILYCIVICYLRFAVCGLRFSFV